MRQDVIELLEKDRVHPRRAARRSLEKACAVLNEGDLVELVLVGGLSVFHDPVPMPEEAAGVLLITREGLVAMGSGTAVSLACTGTWNQVRALTVSGGLGGTRVEARVDGTRMAFFEPYAVRRSDEHRHKLTRICSERLEEGVR